MLRLVLPSLVFLLLVPVTSAQPGSDPPVEVMVGEDTTLPNGRLAPETAMATIPVRATIGCSVPPTLEEIVVEFKPSDVAPWVTVVLNPPSVTMKISPESCTDASYRKVVTSEALVTVARDAPALQTFITTIRVDVTDERGSYGPFEAGFPLMAEYVPLTVVTPATYFVKSEPGKTVVFPVMVNNIGNGPSLIRVEVAQPNKNKLPLINPGPEIRLESRAVSGSGAVFKTTHLIYAETPTAEGYTNSIYTFNAKFMTKYDGVVEEPTMTDETTIVFSIQVQGGAGVPTPAPSVLLLLGLILGMTLWRRGHVK